MTLNVRVTLIVQSLSCAVAGTVVLSAAGSGQKPVNEAIERSRAVFAALRSYSDTGTIVTEMQVSGAPMIVERHSFVTFYRAPRHFYLEFNEDKKAGGDRYVLWGNDEAFHTWWSTTGVQDTFPKGKGALAFNVSVTPTQGMSLLIAPWLFAQAGLEGPLVNLQDAKTGELEPVGERRCHKVTGGSRTAYSRNLDRLRPTTVWVDAQTSLVCKVFQGSAPGTPAGTTQHVTVTFEPRANPAIEDARFLFTPAKKP